MARTATLAIKIIADATKAAKGLQGAGSEVSKFDQRMQKANRGALAVVGGLAAVGTAAFKEANELQQASGAVESVFGKQANAVHQLAKSAADNFGLSRAEYSQTAAVFGAQLKNMGISAGKLVPTTDKLIGLGSDLAATFGGSTADAVSAIGALMRGEADPIERYGVSIKQTDINARLAAQGQDKLTGAAKRTAETEARLALLMEQTADAQGQRAREADTAASRQEVAMAKLKNAGAALGTILLPVVASIAEKFAALAGFVERNATAFQTGAVVVGAFAAAIIATNAAVNAYRATMVAVTAAKAVYTTVTTGGTVALKAQAVASKAAAAAQWLLNAAMTANPIGLVIAAVALLVAGFVLAYKKSETFRKIVKAVMKAARDAVGWVVTRLKDLYGWFASKVPGALNAMKRAASIVFQAVTAQPRLVISVVRNLYRWFAEHVPNAMRSMRDRGVKLIGALTKPISTVVSWVQALIDRIRNISWPSPPEWMRKLGSGLGSLFGSYHGPGGGASSAYAPAVFAAPGELKAAAGGGSVVRRLGGGSSGPTVQIIVQGAVDPISTARQIRRILDRADLATGAPA